VIGGGGFSPRTTELYAHLERWARRNGLSPPVLLSGCRDKAIQMQMQRDWDEGNREGLAVRPATDSAHIPGPDGYCRAFDLGNTPNWLALAGAEVAISFRDATWGGFWLPKDIRHFQIDI
tara:strand:+ start:1230 stop:1589 length:360 start_codon:yes stop_codon:yes gene_type:complete